MGWGKGEFFAFIGTRVAPAWSLELSPGQEGTKQSLSLSDIRSQHMSFMCSLGIFLGAPDASRRLRAGCRPCCLCTTSNFFHAVPCL